MAHSVNLEKLQKTVTSTLQQVLDTHGSELIVGNSKQQVTIDWDGLRSLMERDLRRLLRRELNKRDPLLVLLLQGVEPAASASKRQSKTAAPVG